MLTAPVRDVSTLADDVLTERTPASREVAFAVRPQLDPSDMVRDAIGKLQALRDSPRKCCRRKCGDKVHAGSVRAQVASVLGPDLGCGEATRTPARYIMLSHMWVAKNQQIHFRVGGTQVCRKVFLLVHSCPANTLARMRQRLNETNGLPPFRLHPQTVQGRQGHRASSRQL